jgi:hypothetical protein
LYETFDCIVNPLPLKDLPIVGQSDKKKKAMMHGDEGIGVDGLKELDPGPFTHDGIHIDVDQGISHIHYAPVPLLLSHLTMSFLPFSKDMISQVFPLVKVKTTNNNTYGHTYPFQSIVQQQKHLIMGRTCSIMLAFNTRDIFTCFAFYILFCKGLEMMMGSDKNPTASCTYTHVLSCLMSSLPFTGYLRSHKCDLPKSCALFSQLLL